MGKHILIVGCGVFGLSTAVEAARRGYEVTAIDAYPVPSPWSAAADYNKIIRTEYDDEAYCKLAVDAVKLWKTDSELNEAYIESGRISITPKKHQGRLKFDQKSLEIMKSLGIANQVKVYKNRSKFNEDFEIFKNNSFEEDIHIVYNAHCGVGRASKSLEIMRKRAESLGVKFIFGEKGEAVKVVEDGLGSYVVTKSSQYRADQILICSGAYTGNIVDLKERVSATDLFIGHIKLTKKEYEKYKDIPIVFSSEEGYFFPPDKDTRIVKISAAVEEASHEVINQFGKKISLPRYKTHFPSDSIPEPSARAIKLLLQKVVPELAYHELFDCKICWISDASNSDFLIDKHPSYKNVFVATGDSGHAFKFLPNIGSFIVERLEGKLGKVFADKWAWKERKPSTPSWRVRKVKVDLEDKNIRFYREDRSSKI